MHTTRCLRGRVGEGGDRHPRLDTWRVTSGDIHTVNYVWVAGLGKWGQVLKTRPLHLDMYTSGYIYRLHETVSVWVTGWRKAGMDTQDSKIWRVTSGYTIHVQNCVSGRVGRALKTLYTWSHVRLHTHNCVWVALSLQLTLFPSSRPLQGHNSPQPQGHGSAGRDPVPPPPISPLISVGHLALDDQPLNLIGILCTTQRPSPPTSLPVI